MGTLVGLRVAHLFEVPVQAGKAIEHSGGATTSAETDTVALAWFEGTVVKQDDANRRVSVAFDDGDCLELQVSASPLHRRITFAHDPTITASLACWESAKAESSFGLGAA